MASKDESEATEATRTSKEQDKAVAAAEKEQAKDVANLREQEAAAAERAASRAASPGGHPTAPAPTASERRQAREAREDAADLERKRVEHDRRTVAERSAQRPEVTPEDAAIHARIQESLDKGYAQSGDAANADARARARSRADAAAAVPDATDTHPPELDPATE